jgi:hypothetical protein
MSRLVMLPNARHVPEFPPVSSPGNVGLCVAAYGACGGCGKLGSKDPEAVYLAALRGIITGPWLVVANQPFIRSTAWEGFRSAVGPGWEGGTEGGNRREWARQASKGNGLDPIQAGSTWRRSAQAGKGPQDMEAIELSI